MKKPIIILIIIVAFLAIIIGGGFALTYNYYNKSINKKIATDEIVTISIEQGMNSRSIVDLLYNANFLNNKYVGYAYMKLNSDKSLQAGTYEINRNMSFVEIIDKISRGEVVDNSISITFVEGKRLTYFAKQISQKFPFTEEEILNKLSDKEFLNKLINKYWFLTDDILNDKLYYALEGYLYPSTYYLETDSSIETIIYKLLDQTDIELSKYKTEIENSSYSVHELLTMASIVELEGGNSTDRKSVAGVFYNRLNNNWSLGSDVTTYYAAKIEMSERDLYQYEIDDVNDYNTRPAAASGKLPVGPICNPSSNSIIAALEPTKHDYFFFVADKNGKTYLTKTNAEHVAQIQKLREQGLWYEYS